MLRLLNFIGELHRVIKTSPDAREVVVMTHDRVTSTKDYMSKEGTLQSNMKNIWNLFSCDLLSNFY